jgi:hypothetical protein
MLTARALATAAFVIGFLANGPTGQDLSQYRNFALGKRLGLGLNPRRRRPAEAKMIHQRPAVLQDTGMETVGLGSGIHVGLNGSGRKDRL